MPTSGYPTFPPVVLVFATVGLYLHFENTSYRVEVTLPRLKPNPYNAEAGPSLLSRSLSPNVSLSTHYQKEFTNLRE